MPSAHLPRPDRVRLPFGACAVCLLGAISTSSCGAADATEGASATPVPVVVREVSRMHRPESVRLSGDVVAWRMANVGFLVPGVVASAGPREGDAVAQGDVLAELDPTEYRLNLEIATAQRERAEDEHGRAETMFAASAIPENDFHKAGTALRLARAQEELATKKLADTRLVAPMGGIVAHRGIEPGEQAGPGVPAFTIVRIDPVQVRAGVPETEIGRVAVGQPATVSIPALDNATFEGRVGLVGIAADPASRTYTVKIDVRNPERVLRPGMIAEVAIQGDRSLEILTVPGEAIVRGSDGITRVFVYFPDEARVHGVRVNTGSAYGTEVEIVDGLTGEELVVVGGQHRVREGSLVDIGEGAEPTGGTEPTEGR